MSKPLWGKSILLAESDSTLRRLIRESLTEMGAEVETTEDPRIIANLTSKKVFDLMILQQKIENIDAKIISKTVMSKPDYADSHMIILANAVEMEDLEARREHGISTYIVKPFQMDKLIGTIQKLLDN
ncbi:MAG: response regulator [Pseudomonadota bacterium]